MLIPAQPEQIGQVYGLLARFGEATEAWIGDGMVYPVFMTAVVEIATNIMRHAYTHDQAGGEMELVLTLYAGRLEACFCDQGVEFRPTASNESVDLDLAAGDEPLDLPEGGFGLFVARQALTQLDYRRTPDGDNCWTLVKEF